MNGISSRLVAAAFALSASFALQAQTVQGLDLSLHTPHRSVALDSAVTVNVTLRNTRTNGPLAVGRMPDWTDNGGMSLYVLKSDGALDPVTAAPRLPGATGSERQLRIEAGSALSLRRTVRVTDFAKAPGEYRLVAEYRPANGSARSLVSAPITIRVKAAQAR